MLVCLLCQTADHFKLVGIHYHQPLYELFRHPAEHVGVACRLNHNLCMFSKPFREFSEVPNIFFPQLFETVRIPHAIREIVSVKVHFYMIRTDSHFLASDPLFVMKYRIEAELLLRPHQPPTHYLFIILSPCGFIEPKKFFGKFSIQILSIRRVSLLFPYVENE